MDKINKIDTSESIEIKNELEQKILDLTMMIKEKYPELSKYIEETPVTIPTENIPEIDREELHKYYETLISVLKKYVEEHPEFDL